MAGNAAQIKASLPPDLMDRLSAMQVVAGSAQASRGAGEKPSRASGQGMEFAEYRAYRAGDDLRHVDARSLALGSPLTRSYVQRRQLMVSIIVDLTPSMLTDGAAKALLALDLAKALGFSTLAGQDRVEVLVLGEKGETKRSPVWQGRSRAPELFAFASLPKINRVSDEVPQRAQLETLKQACASVLPRLDRGSIVVVISDFWEANAAEALALLASSPASVVCLQLLSAIELDPSALGEGVHRLIDAETGIERDIAVTGDLVRKYKNALEDQCTTLRSAISERNVFLTLPAEQSLSTICLETLPAAGVLQ